MKYLILGGGPAGLTFANKLRERGEDSFLVLEKESEGGGLCRSKDIDGASVDIGGGHFLDVRRPSVNEFLFQFMPQSEWNIFERDSRIVVGDETISHPIESNIWQMSINKQVEYLKSIAIAGCNIGQKMPERFTDWIYWKLGNKIAEDYMIPYNQKMFGQELDELGTYWLDKLPSVSFEETLLSCLEKRAYGKQPGHAQFYYPKRYGYGELWRRMGCELGKNIEYNKKVNNIDFNTHMVKTSDGAQYSGEIIVTTIPWLEFEEILGLPEEIKADISKLKYSSIQVRYYPENMDTTAHWIYYPDSNLAYHRILVRSNFCPNSRGYWTETNSERVRIEDIQRKDSYLNKYAYPLNTIDKPKIMKRLLTYSKNKKIYGLGRWGEHQHYNSDVTVDLALRLCEECIKENK